MWLYMEVLVIPCVAVVVLLYDCIRTWWLWSIMNEDATLTINVKDCTSTNHCAVMLDYRGYTSSYEKGKIYKRKKCPQM